MPNERGLVISVPITADQNHFRVYAKLDEQELRHSLLFWDKLDFPQNNLVRTGDHDADFLESAGVLKKTMVHLQFRSGPLIMGEKYVEAHLAAYRALDNAEPGVWSLGVGKNSVSFPNRELEQGRGIFRIKMFRCRISWNLEQNTEMNFSILDIILTLSTSAYLPPATANWLWSQKLMLWNGRSLTI